VNHRLVLGLRHVARLRTSRSPGWPPLVRVPLCAGLCASLVISAPGAMSTAAPITPAGSCANTAAETFGWQAPIRADDFSDPSSLAGWKIYNGPGHKRNGRRTPQAVDVSDGLLTITGDAEGNSGGMAWNPGQLYGRWEVCMKSSPASPNYHSVVLLWPDSENWPLDGEIDFMEIFDPTRQVVTTSVLHSNPHIPPDDNYHAKVAIDATQWHAWAVEWTPDHVAGYVDGVQWFEVIDHIPRNPMHLCIQLDNFGGDVGAGGQQSVDWARQYTVV
jgi:hypothetical protein